MDSKTVESRAHYEPRLEDDALVRGLGRYAADVTLTGQAYAYFVRSPHAFADIRAMDTEGARGTPGGGALPPPAEREGCGTVPQPPPLVGRDGRKLIVP